MEDDTEPSLSNILSSDSLPVMRKDGMEDRIPVQALGVVGDSDGEEGRLRWDATAGCGHASVIEVPNNPPVGPFTVHVEEALQFDASSLR